MEELGREIQVILQRVNLTFAVRNRAIEDEFVGLQEAIQATLQEISNVRRGPPPAAKEEVEKLSITVVTSSVLARLGEDTHCAVCREPLVLGDNMQEMPCQHPYHLECLRPWLENHNSCPICRYELRTDDEDYEHQKQLSYNAELQRRLNCS
uniref:RING-type E3 ubiquitin transferase n=2 Tax=Physcomitrium patens TaxID=3218 RepID=A0A2K1L6Y8_PHYPA|nr:hypothetical protein PHYPA_000234 [Physcomitrium patens]